MEATGDLIGNKIADKITRASKTSLKNNLKINEEELLREKYVSPDVRQKIIDVLRLKEQNCQKILQINRLNSEQKNGLKKRMNHVERITLIVKLNLKLQC